jgi:alpha,alpha-trehalose phosphorylase
VLQSGARAERRAIAAKGLTGPGYDGHSFWDTEMFVLPVLCYVHPEAAADALRWRHSTLDLARDRARQLGWKGAAFPWRTIRGQECSAYWPAGSAAVHVNADISDAALRYVRVTGDTDFERDVAVEILVETARLWLSLGHHDLSGSFRLQGVTGPDEYSALAHDNLFTNLMAQQNLREAAALVERYPDVADALAVHDDEVAAWQAAADLMHVPYDEHLQVHPQSEGFTDLAPWDFSKTKPDDYPLLLTAPYGELYRRQVVKQADAVLAMHWRGDAFTAEEKAHGFAYYEPLTVRDSSLSACTQAVVAAEVGHLDLAHAYVGEAALTDLRDLAHNTKDGLHIASLAGAWLGLVAGFGGMRDFGGQLSFSPRLPHFLRRLTFSVRWRGHRLRVSTDGRTTTYVLRDEGSTLELWHDGQPLQISSDRPVTVTNAEVHALTPVPQQPPGREPVHRHPASR